MAKSREIPGRKVLETIAVENGVGVAVVDRSGIEVQTANNNSICATLNPDGELVGPCASDCGQALEKAVNSGGTCAFTCHAGLECRAAALSYDQQPVAVIAGRTFVKSENYRRATERAVAGDWREYPPADLFENILLTGSSEIITAAMASIIDSSVEIETEAAGTHRSINADQSYPPDASIDEAAEQPSGIVSAEPRLENAADAQAWRSFFSSLLSRDHTSARNAMIEFLHDHYGLNMAVWLEKRGSRLESVAVSAGLRGRRVRLGIDSNDERLIDAARGEMPVELGEKNSDSSKNSRRILLFALPVGEDIPAAMAVLDDVESHEKRRQIARFCHTVAPQLEILRLRSEVSRQEMLSSAAKRVTEGLRDVESKDVWMHLTAVSAELLQAERASLMTRTEDEERLEVKASLGSTTNLLNETNAGERVARIVFEKGKPVVVKDVAATGLPPAGEDRNYKTGSFISAPVMLGGRQLAVINFTDKVSGRSFDHQDLETVRAITPQLAAAIDRTMLKERAGEFEQLSVTDALTGLLNRRYIEQRLNEEVKRSNRHGYPMSFIMLDVDHFKSYNDTFGHPAGDEALKIVAQVIRDTLRGADVAARFGGEEFAILLPQTTDDEAANIAERVRHNVDMTEFPSRKVTISVGVASCSSELCSTIDLVSAADKALYSAKSGGRNRICIYEQIAGEIAKSG